MAFEEIVTRGMLPHWYVPGYAHFVTYRMADSIPSILLKKWRATRDFKRNQGLPPGLSASDFEMRLHKQFFQTYDRYLDRYSGSRGLEAPAIASMLRENLYHHDGTRYQLLAWCIMPNHVHILIQPLERAALHAGKSSFDVAVFSGTQSDEIADVGSPLSGIMHSLKSYTANEANRILERSGKFWQSESYDHWVRDLEELERIVEYICYNPVKAGLVRRPTEWKFSSAYDRYQQDRSTCGLVGRLRDDWYG